jgi:hypothetical protein
MTGPRQDKIKFPIRWVSHKTRLGEDLERAFQIDSARELFSNEYFKSLSDQVAQQDARIIKIQIFALAIYGYLALAFATPDASLSILGVSVKNHQASEKCYP